MINFTHCPINKLKGYGGANGNKINIMYKETSYMLKFPPHPSKNKAMSYSNSCISEYISCHIYATLGFSVQDTLLGTFTDKKGREKIVVACKDFTADEKELMEFAQLKNTCIDSDQNGYGTELSTILMTIEEQELVEKKKMVDFFWEMFIVDALIGNFDRHNANWGILVDKKAQKAEIAPIYDCGSSLFPQLDVGQMQRILEDENELNNRVFVYPTSAILEDNKKINYFDFISSGKNIDCNNALERICRCIDINRITNFIDNMPVISNVQKDFYKKILSERKSKILDNSMKGIGFGIE